VLAALWTRPIHGSSSERELTGALSKGGVEEGDERFRRYGFTHQRLVWTFAFWKRTVSFRPSEAALKSLIKLFLRAHLNVLGYFGREILAFFNSPPKRFNEASISFVAAGLRSRSGCVW
jgi:hypothetical protein